MIRVKCPKCQKVLGLEDSKAGAPALCPACKQKFMVPGKAKAAAGAKKPDAAKPAADAWKKPGTEDDDFTPYTLAAEPPGKAVDDKHVDDMVRFAMLQRKRDKAWKNVGFPSKVIKIIAMIHVALSLLSFAYFSMVIVLFLHKQRQGINSPPLFPFNDIRPENFPAGWIWLGLFGSLVISLVIYGFILSGAESMKKLESWGMALTSAILSILFLGFFGVAFGFWAISILMDKEVKAEFGRGPGEDLEEAEELDDDEDDDDPDEEEDDEDEDDDDDD